LHPPEPEVAEAAEADLEPLPLPESEWEPGIVVKLHNLKAKAELNGQWGVLVEFSEPKKRWLVRIDGMEDMALRAENLVPVSQEEYDAWVAEQGANEPAKEDLEEMLKSKVCSGKTRWTDSQEIPLLRKPGIEGNEFDILMGGEPDGALAARKIADIIKERGVCLVEANAPSDLLCAAYEEAEKMYKAGEFAPPMQDFGASDVEMMMWQRVLFQDESKVKWIDDDLEKMQALRVLSTNMRDFAGGLSEFLGKKLGISWDNMWDGMLTCYTGDRTYSFHLDNPNMPADENSLPDNGLRLTVAYFINPHWSPEDNYNGGGLDLYLSDPSGPPTSLASASKAKRIRVAPHADTLVCFPSQRMAHQVITTKGRDLWFCLWLWCFEEAMMCNFPTAVHQHWQKLAGVAVSPAGSAKEGSDDEAEVISD